jgi:hypothetical protein
MKTVWVVLVALLALVAVVAGLGWRFEWSTQARVSELQKVSAPAGATISFARLSTLPVPVQRYLRSVLREGAPLPRTARIAHAGDFLATPPAGWAPFVSVEYFAASPPGFVWDARITMAPGLPVKVRDAFVNGEGEMRAAIWGVIPVMNVAGTPDIAQGALIRYLAESPWFPAALLPENGVRWQALDANSARATLQVGSTVATVDFFFDSNGLIERMYSPARMRDVDGVGVATPWQGRMSGYSWRGGEQAGMQVPTYGEVGWLLPAGEQVYWKGRVTDAQYLP